MKKLICLCLASLATLCLTGCNNGIETEYNYTGQKDNILEVLCIHTFVPDVQGKILFIRDTTTENMYICCYADSLQPYYNEKGEIMKYDEFQKVHKHVKE